MIFTLAWKEIREHQGVWITMVFMSIVLGLGLSKIVALGGDPGVALPVATLTILGMAATYGVVCGAMMLAGEHEGGTLVFLDIFHGRRGRLWSGKLAIGALLTLTQALAVAALLFKLQPESPRWLAGIVGQGTNLAGGGGVVTEPSVWFFVLPVVTIEAFFWGMLGSSLTQRVLAGAAIAAAIFTPVLLMAILAPPEVFVVVRILAILGCLTLSFVVFVNQSLDGSQTPQIQPAAIRLNERKEHFLDQFDRLERETELEDDEPAEPVSIPVSAREQQPAWEEPAPARPSSRASRSSPIDLPDEPRSPAESLWWLTRQQVGHSFWIMAVVSFFVGLFIVPVNFQLLWPLATLLIGVVCGTLVFAQEQSQLSYQCLIAQHLPMRQIWRFKILFWLGLAVLVSLILAVASGISILLLSANQAPLNFPGTFYGLFGPLLFLGVWLMYGFCTGQLIVWLCRKTILALLVSTMVAITSVGLWFPAIMCGGMSGWQMWAPPLTMLAATCVLVRAWAGGRIWERKPVMALAGYGAAILVWALVVAGYRGIEVPSVAEPLDIAAFRESLPEQKDNLAAKAIQKAIGEFGEGNPLWWNSLDEAKQMPPGVLETPRSDGQVPVLTHLPPVRKMAETLLDRARVEDTPRAVQHLNLVLMLTRNLRNKAAVQSYLVGVELEDKATAILEDWLIRRRPAGVLMRQALADLKRHADDTPPPLDCLKTECFRSSGVAANPAMWTFAPAGRDVRMPEQWLPIFIAAAMEAPWESMRKDRIWRLVWAGQLRHMETPHWDLPALDELPKASKEVTDKTMATWLPNPDGGPSRHRVARLLDSSWLADEQIFPNARRLRHAGARAQWRVDALRLMIALRLYQLDNAQPAPDLNALVPNYFDKLPVDPYSGASYNFAVAPNRKALRLWSTGPDGVNHGALRDGTQFEDHDAIWKMGAFDLIRVVTPG